MSLDVESITRHDIVDEEQPSELYDCSPMTNI